MGAGEEQKGPRQLTKRWLLSGGGSTNVEEQIRPNWSLT